MCTLCSNVLSFYVVCKHFVSCCVCNTRVPEERYNIVSVSTVYSWNDNKAHLTWLWNEMPFAQDHVVIRNTVCLTTYSAYTHPCTNIHTLCAVHINSTTQHNSETSVPTPGCTLLSVGATAIKRVITIKCSLTELLTNKREIFSYLYS